VVELTVHARVKPAEADAVRQTVLDRVNKLLVSRRESVPADAAE
jgi:hypothetical protein